MIRTHPLLVTERVLFPWTRLQFHLTDPDRQETARAALLGDGRLIARPQDDDFDSEIATVCTIFDYFEPTPTRTVVTIAGMARARIRAVHPRGGQAVADWVHLPERVDDETTAAALSSDILGTLDSLAVLGVEMAGQVAKMAAHAARPAAVADIVASVTVDDPAEQLDLLEQTDVLARLTLVHGRLMDLIAQC